MPAKKKINIPQVIIDIFQYGVTWNEDGTTATLSNPIDNYAAFKKVVEQLGGHWDKRLKTHFGSTNQHKEFHRLVNEHGFWKPLPEGSFKESGTGVNSVLVVLEKQ